MDRQKLLIAIFAAAFIGSLGLNVMLYGVARENYAEAINVRLKPIDLDRFAAPPKAPTPVMLFGDSRIEMWPPFEVGGSPVANHGISGETTSQMLGRLDMELTRHRPKVVVIQAGINDLKAIGVMPLEKGRIVSDTESRLSTMISKIRSSGAQVVVLTVFPFGDVPIQRQSVWNDHIEEGRKLVNGYLLSLHVPGVRVVDCDQLLAAPSGKIQGEFAQDLLHLNKKAYAKLTPVITEAIRSLSP